MCFYRSLNPVFYMQLLQNNSHIMFYGFFLKIEIAPNLPLDRFPMVEHLRKKLGLPAALLNDGRASALGEHAIGQARGADPLLCLFFGTGTLNLTAPNARGCRVAPGRPGMARSRAALMLAT